MFLRNHVFNSVRRTRLVWALVLCMAVAFVFLFGINHWTMNLSLAGEEVVTVEYGTLFEDPGAEATLYGTLLFQEGVASHVTVSGKVDSQKLGTYTLTYKATGMGTKATAQRTVIVSDTTAPKITLKQRPGSYTLPGGTYSEEGYTAVDACDGDLTDEVRTVQMGDIVVYTVMDSSGNRTTVRRKLLIDDPVAPVITLEQGEHITVKAGLDFEDPGFTAIDNCDGDVTSLVQVSGSIDTYQLGDQTLEYAVSDNYGNVAHVQRTVTVEPIRQSDNVIPGDKNVYLTFDDGPSPFTKGLLETLDKYNVKATFFTVNTEEIDLIKDEVAAGHTVAIHSASHMYNKIYKSEDAYFKDLYKQQKVIEKYTGITSYMLRFPGGSSNEQSKLYCRGIMTRLTKSVLWAGFQYYDWNVTSGDAGETTSTDKIYRNIIEGIQKHENSVILQHDTKDFSVNAVERVIIWGLAHGYTFLPLTEDSPEIHHAVLN